MIALWISLAVLGAVLLFVIIAMVVSFFMAFYSPKRKKKAEGEFDMPFGDNYEPYYDEMKRLMTQFREMKGERVSITSRDGLTLYGTYYGGLENAPLEIMVHGYRGTPERDMCGGVHRAKEVGHNALLIEQRASGESEGKVITFGIKERLDCLDWVDYAVKRFGKDTKIILTGISMGASTVIMASGETLPDSVVGVIADCGYSSPKEIIKRVIKRMRLPVSVFYPLLKLGARIFGGFNLEECSPVEQIKKCKIPVFIAHGEKDAFVPVKMADELYEACSAPKVLLKVPSAGHGLSFLLDEEGYVNGLNELAKLCGIEGF